MNSKLEFTTTNRNALVLNYQGYQYTIKRQYKETNEWRCRQRPCTTSLSLCRANISMIREPSHHTCTQSSPKKLVLDEAISRMKKRAGEETLPIPQIYSQEIIKVRVNNPDMNTGTFFPLLDSIDSSLYRKRAQNYPKIPRTIHELIIPDGWKLGSHGEPFLLVDEIYGNERLLMFASDWSIRFLGSCSQWHSDGTYKCRPLLFAQVYIIFGFNGMMIPCVYCLTTKQDERVYMKILHNLLDIARQKGVNLNPERLTCDYELAAINAFKKFFLQYISLVVFFIFHNHSGERSKTEEKRKGSQWFLCAIGLALIPVHLVEKTWAEAMDEHTPNHRSSVKFNDYIVSTYVDRTSCRYPVTLWNVNDALNSNIPRTNNHVEGYNSRLGSLFPVHPHIYKFIELLRDEHLFQHHHAEQSRTYLPRRQKPSQDTNAQLIDLLNKHSNRELTDLELALQCGKAVKTQLSRGRQYYHHMWYTLPWPFDEFFHEYAPYKWITKVQVFEIPSKKMATMDQSSLRSLDASRQTLSSSTCTLPYVAFSDCIETYHLSFYNEPIRIYFSVFAT
ncbi:unnamed protein product [Rotaria socialis]